MKTRNKTTEMEGLFIGIVGVALLFAAIAITRPGKQQKSFAEMSDDELLKIMDQYVKTEQYEQAAKIRDILKQRQCVINQ